MLLSPAFGQSVRVEITVEYVSWSGYVGDEYGPRIRIYRDAFNDPREVLLSNPCIKLGNASSGSAYPGDTFQTYQDMSSPLDIFFVSHEERKAGSEDCTAQGIENISFKKPDRFEEKSQITLMLSDYAPGVSHTFNVRNAKDGSVVNGTLKIRYTPPQPTSIVSSITGNICANLSTTLTTQIKLRNGIILSDRYSLSYEWEYSTGDKDNPLYIQCRENCRTRCEDCINGGGTQNRAARASNLLPSSSDCSFPCNTCFTNCDRYDPKVPDWLPLGRSNNSNAFAIDDPLQDLFQGILVQNKTVRFRVRVVTSELNSDFSATYTFNFSPAAPYGFTITADQSCPNAATGKIRVTNIQGSGQYKYYVKEGGGYDITCNPTDQSKPCLNGEVDKGNATANSIETRAIAQGGRTYTIWISNSGGTKGSCVSKQEVVIEPFPVLAAPSFEPPTVSCHGQADATLVALSSGGNPMITFELNNLDNNKKESIQKNTNEPAEFTALAAANYLLRIKDQCQQEVTQAFTVKQPSQITGQLSISPATCNLPGNGSIEVTLQNTTGSLDIAPTGNYAFTISNSSGIVHSEESSNTRWGMAGLPSGAYTLQVSSVNGRSCNGYNSMLTIDGPLPLDVSAILDVPSVLCFHDETGKITLSGTGGSGIYSFELKRLDDQTILTSTSGIFDELRAANYHAIVKSNLPGCQDKFEKPDVLTITEPPGLSVDVEVSNISCFAAADGVITVAASGGTIGSSSQYIYAWERRLAGGWIPTGQTGPVLMQLQAGEYRVKVQDNNACKIVSEPVVIIEPERLTINQVEVNDIQCLGDAGHIQLQTDGGTVPILAEYSLDKQMYQVLLPSTSLDAGDYFIRVRDKNNCLAEATRIYSITRPAAALDFQYTLSNYNGYNISCFGGSNGSINITPIGGNGSGYKGYEFALDNNNFITENLINGIDAGLHTVSTRDQRGCVVSKSIMFSQSNQAINPQVVYHQDVVCFGDKSGVIELAASGGVAPYQFKLAGNNFQTSGKFNNLSVGVYDFVLSDLNRCEATFREEIRSLYPAIETTASIQDVRCYGGNDGGITVSGSGGVAPLQYLWLHNQSSTSSIDRLIAGSYTLQVTDRAGCSREWTFPVAQPEAPVMVSAIAKPVCYNKTDGTLTLSATGGTSPFEFSVDNGSTWQSNPLFTTLLSGNYTIQARDSKGCVDAGLATIAEREDKPKLDFLAATKRQALDTLVIVDISIPAPDSIYWTFDPRAHVVKSNVASPEILFDEPGTYSVKMKAFFSGCDYEMEKQITLSPYDSQVLQEKKPNYSSIKSFQVTPNPTTGAVEAQLVLNKRKNASITVIDMLGTLKVARSYSDLEEIIQPIDLSGFADGIYVVRAITETDAREIRVVVNHQ
jgi:hypothetical protein